MNSSSSAYYFRHLSLRRMGGAFWLIAGFMLLTKGIGFLKNLMFFESSHPLLDFYLNLTQDKETAVALLIATALALGMMKAIFILRKVAKKACLRLSTFPDPAPISALFGFRFLVIITGAMLMAYCVRQSGLSPDIRGVIDVAVGAALLNSAMIYLRAEKKVNPTKG